jgi:hypothetical protein
VVPDKVPDRGTQSLVHTLADCWRRPSLLALELVWRWAFGIPALALLFYEGARIAAGNPLAGTGYESFSLQDPWRAAVIAQDMFAAIWPPVRHVALWMLPLLAVAWAVVSGVGRNAVLRRFDPALPRRWGTLIVLQFLRVVMLGASCAVWFLAIRWAAGYALGTGEAEPNLVLYLALVICISLGIFTVWALLSWIFYAAPLIGLLENRGAAASVARSMRLGSLRGKFVEVNLVMGIIKLALIVLAMVFSATPLPFATVMTGAPLYTWWAVVTVLYCVASDFFQVARLVAFIEFWKRG